MTTPLFEKIRDAVLVTAPGMDPQELQFNVLIDADGLVHVYECITDGTTPAVMTLRDLQASRLCHVGTRSNDGLLPAAFMDALCDQELATALTLFGITETVMNLDTYSLRSKINSGHEAYRLADWYLNTVHEWHKLMNELAPDLTETYAPTIAGRLRDTRNVFQSLHGATIGHDDVRRSLLVHERCDCEIETIGLTELPAISFLQHVATVNEIEDPARIFGLLSSYKDYVTDPGALYDLPSCVVDLVQTRTPMYVRSERLARLTGSLRETAMTLWTPEGDGPFVELTAAVEAAQKLLV
jgi:hypothetical protein